MHPRALIALLALGFAAACSDREPLDPPVAPAPAFARASCDLGVSTEDALAAIGPLIDQVNALEAAGSLTAGQARALRNHLTNAERALLEGRACAAQAQLRAFRTQVESFEDAGALTGEEAGPLLDTVDDLLGDTPVVTFAQIAAGGLHSCGLTASGRAYCWGFNQFGQLGDGSTTDRLTPVPVSGDLVFSSIEAGTEHTCGLTAAGAAYCWGRNDFGWLGDGTETSRSTPTAVVGGLEFAAISAGWHHTCGLTAAGTAYCWGGNSGGKLGNGTLGPVGGSQPFPTAVTGDLVFTSITAALIHTCGVTTTGVAYCWGQSFWGELGDGTIEFSGRPNPAPVVTSVAFRSISAGLSHTCALDVTGSAWCWGYNGEAELGDGTLVNKLTPVLVLGGLTFDFLAIGDFHGCGLTSGGEAHCWGRGLEGQIGDGARENRPAPVPIAEGLPFRLVSGGNQHTCALGTDDAAYCWGNNGVGQLGDGTLEDHLTPGAVLGSTRLP